MKSSSWIVCIASVMVYLALPPLEELKNRYGYNSTVTGKPQRCLNVCFSKR